MASLLNWDAMKSNRFLGELKSTQYYGLFTPWGGSRALPHNQVAIKFPYAKFKCPTSQVANINKVSHHRHCRFFNSNTLLLDLAIFRMASSDDVTTRQVVVPGTQKYLFFEWWYSVTPQWNQQRFLMLWPFHVLYGLYFHWITWTIRRHLQDRLPVTNSPSARNISLLHWLQNTCSFSWLSAAGRR